MDKPITFAWLLLLGAVVAVLAVPETRAVFAELTRDHPYPMGILKIGLLGTMGELLGARIGGGRWRLRGIRLHQRALVWGFLGLLFTVVFPLFSFGVEGLLKRDLLPGAGSTGATAFWKSFWMNIIFAFPMMVFHRVTDTLIERGVLFSLWPLVDVYTGIDWRGMFRVVGLAIFWFWIPAHTVTFLLPPEFRVVTAALLAVGLGVILGLAKRIADAQRAASGKEG
jgi:hypothetical protein